MLKIFCGVCRKHIGWVDIAYDPDGYEYFFCPEHKPKAKYENHEKIIETIGAQRDETYPDLFVGWESPTVQSNPEEE